MKKPMKLKELPFRTAFGATMFWKDNIKAMLQNRIEEAEKKFVEIEKKYLDIHGSKDFLREFNQLSEDFYGVRGEVKALKEIMED